MLTRLLSILTIFISPFSVNAQTIELYFSNHQVLAGDTVCVQLSAVEFQNIAALQFTLQWPSNALTFVSSKSVLDDFTINSTQAADGVLQIAWLDFTGQSISLPDSSWVFEFCFIASPCAPDLKARIALVNEPTPIEISQFNGSSITPLTLVQQETCVEIIAYTPLDLGQDTILCSGNSVFLNAMDGGLQYKWYRNREILSHQEAVLEVSIPGIYTVEKTLSDDCVLADSIQLSFVYPDTTYLTSSSCNPLDTGVFDQILTNKVGCDSLIRTHIVLENDASFNISVQSAPQDCHFDLYKLTVTPLSDDPGPFVYSIDGSPFSMDSVFSDLKKGDHQIIVQNPSGCEQIKWVTIRPIPELQISLDEQQRINLGDSLQLMASTNRDSLVAITWSPAKGLSCTDCLNPIASPRVSTIYTLDVEDAFGCKAITVLSIIVDSETPAYAPTAFSPNQDGVNDLFELYFKPEKVKEISSFHIFDRWGNKIFSANGGIPDFNSVSWDGNAHDEPVSTGVYIWFLEIIWTNGEKDILQGDVALIR